MISMISIPLRLEVFLLLAVAVSVYALGHWCVAAARSWRCHQRAAALLRQHPAAGSVALAELCLVHGTPFLLICGGEPERDLLGAQLGTKLARLPHGRVAFFSSGHFKLREDFQRMEGVQWELLQQLLVLDRDALDTLSNFTSFLRHLRRKGWLKQEGGSASVDVVVLTSAYHARRIRGVAALLLGFYGLSFHVAEVELPTGTAPQSESLWRCIRDVLRAALWLVSGFEGDVLAGWMHQDRRDFRRWYRSKRG